MSTSVNSRSGSSRSFVPSTALAKSVSCTEHELVVALKDGRVLSVPLAWFPTLKNATPTQRANCEIGGGGIGLHWPELDEDLSMAGLMAGIDPQSA